MFWLLPSKIVTVKKKKKHSKEKKYFVKFKDSLCNKFKFIQKSAKGKGFALCSVCESDFRVVEKMISIDTGTPQIITYMWITYAAQQERKLTDVDASSVTTNLDQK